ncbi:MAG: ATP phosphoribosyltransferase regulatory subunit, partial [Chitinispirillaceae bacterium]|nr:ATP phosphoribosyltransferase regulatory subunit [Chitinispirillaceae bacterium]
YSIPRLFRYEKMQKGRLREFFQLNMDILGSSEITADAELIAAVIDMMRDLGLTDKDFQVRISSRTLLEECFAAVGLPLERYAALYALLDRKNKISPEAYDKDLADLIPEDDLRAKVNSLFTVETLDDITGIAGSTSALATLRQLFSLLDTYGMQSFAGFDINIVRGLAYYTGIVFEVFALGTTMRAIAGGGRYDKLVELYGGPPTPAVGFAAGDVVLGDLLAEKGLLPPVRSRCTVFIVALDDTGFDGIIGMTRTIRNAGIACEFPLRKSGVGKQLKQADATGAKLTLFYGGEELVNGEVKIKRMADGKEQTVAIADCIDTINNLLHKS